MIWFYLIAAAIVVLDQITKWAAVRYIMPSGTIPLIDGVLHFTYVENTGAAFGMMTDARWIFMITSVAAIAVLTVLIAKYASGYKFAVLCVTFILGGGVGNMIDRVRIGYVIDFIDFRLINFAVFNVADSFVTVGAAMLIAYLVREMILDAKRPKTGASSEAIEESESVASDETTDASSSDTEESGVTDGDRNG